MLFVLALAAAVPAGEIHVDRSHPAASDGNAGTRERPLATVDAAAQRARAGDTVLVHAGTYRESVRLRFSGTAEAPIVFRAAEPGAVVISGTDEVEGWARVGTPGGGWGAAWPQRFSIGEDEDGRPIEHHPEDAPLWGRAEQVFVDGVRLKPVATLGELRAGDAVSEARLGPVVPAVGGRFGGVFHVHEAPRMLVIRLPDGAAPEGRRIEASTRDLLFGTTPWDGDGEGVRHVHVSGFIFRGAAGFPQRPAVWLHGRDNVVEDCAIEGNAGAGVKVDGTLRRCLIRDNGHIGGGATGDGATHESSVWIGNSWKPISRGWEAGGTKIVRSHGGAFRDCAFIGNGGPGLWLDIDVRDMRIERCVFERNELHGLFIEISRGITVEDCLARGNGRFADDWGVGGITVAESMDVTIRDSTLVGNRDGLAIREQGPRVLDTAGGDVPFTVRDLVVERTLARDNTGYQLALWWDNPGVGAHPSAEADEGKPRLDPDEAGLKLGGNRWVQGERGGGKLALWGVPWRAASAEIDSLDDLRQRGWETTPQGDEGVGWAEAPRDALDWARERLPAWMASRVADDGH